MISRAQEKVSKTVLISDKTHFQAESFTINKVNYHIFLEVAIHQENTATLIHISPKRNFKIYKQNTDRTTRRN